MQFELTPDQVRRIIGAAQIAARRLEWRLRLPRGDWEDLRQDLLSDLFRRLPSYDPERGPLKAFVQVVFTHRAARLARQVRTQRSSCGALLSLDLPLDDDPRPLRERIAEDEGLWSAGHASEDGADNRHDVARVLDLLPEHDRRLCAGLATHTAAALARLGQGSRSGLYRRIGELRCVLTAHGLGPCWDDRAAA